MENKEFYIPCDGLRLHAKLVFPAVEKEKYPLVIIIHGFTGHMEEPHIVAVSETCNEIGFATLRVEMYGHGKSDGAFKDHTLFKWLTNALAVMDYAKHLDMWAFPGWSADHAGRSDGEGFVEGYYPSVSCVDDSGKCQRWRTSGNTIRSCTDSG